MHAAETPLAAAVVVQPDTEQHNPLLSRGRSNRSYLGCTHARLKTLERCRVFVLSKPCHGCLRRRRIGSLPSGEVPDEQLEISDIDCEASWPVDDAWADTTLPCRRDRQRVDLHVVHVAQAVKSRRARSRCVGTICKPLYLFPRHALRLLQF